MNRIKELRMKENMMQKELAEKLQVAQNTLSYWEKGTYQPDNIMLQKLADIFNVSTDYILGRREIHDTNFYRILLSDKGLKLVRKQLVARIESYGYEKLQEELNMNFSDLKSFLTSDLTIGTKCSEQLDKILITLETNLYELFEEAFINDDMRMYYDLDDIDKAEIRGEMKNMLKANKYTHDAYLAAFGGAVHAPDIEKTPDAVRKIFQEERNGENKQK